MPPVGTGSSQKLPDHTDPDDLYDQGVEAVRSCVDQYQREIETLIHCLIDLGTSVREAGSASRMRKADLSFKSKDYNAFRDHLRIVLQSYHAYEAEQSGQFETTHAIKDVLSIELRPEQNHMIEANLRRRHRCAWASYRASNIRSSNVAHQHDAQQQQPEPAVALTDDRKSTIDSPAKPNAAVVRGSQAVASVSTVRNTVLQNALKLKMPKGVPVAIPKSQLSTRNTKITAEIVYPRPPRVALSGRCQSFQCPYCRDTLPSDIARSQSAWKWVSRT
jgi:hypothetical protein